MVEVTRKTKHGLHLLAWALSPLAGGLTGTADTINCLHLWGRWRRIPRPFLFLVGKASLAHLEDPSFDDHTVILLHMGDKSSIHDHIRILKQCQLFIVQKSFDR